MSERVAVGPSGASDMEALFRASGQLGRDLLAVEWGETPLGPPLDWPQSLRTVVHVLLTSRFSMWMAWGPDLTFFANDKYRHDTLGAKYPWALGKPAREVWAEIWTDIGPRIEAVMRTGVASWDESLRLFLERSGYREETYHTFSYSPLTDDAGSIAGLLCVVSEDTQRVVGERRLSILRSLGSELTAARSESEVLTVVRRELGRALEELPFSLVYLFEDASERATLACAAGVTAGHPVAPEVLGGPASPWPVSVRSTDGALEVRGLGERFAEVPRGAWDEPPQVAVVVPVPGPSDDRPLGLLVAALNRYRPFDAEYEGFIDLVAGQIAASVSNGRAYDAERRRAEELAELDRAKTTFFTNVSHEFRTPLTLLLGPTADALGDRDHPLDPVQQGRLELVQANGERLLTLVNDLLDFSRLESGRMEAQLEPVDLGAYTAAIAHMFASVCHEAGLGFEVDCPRFEQPALVDKEMWAKIVSNLLSNALKFTFEGAIAVRLRQVDDGAGGPRVELEVTDTGIGIAEAEQAHLFERFHRVSGARSRTHEGSGIGLALVAELAELHGGSARATSRLGQGSRFTVEIPLAPADPEAVDPAHDDDPVRFSARFLRDALRWFSPDESQGLEHPASGDEAPPRVLVVDDNADMRRYITSLLAGTYRVEVAPDGQTALDMVRAAPPDLVLTDVMMPRLDGFGLLAQIRADPATVSTPVVMLSARAGEESAVEGLNAGADDYLVKPFSALELLARVRSTLSLERARRDAASREHQIAEHLQRSLLPPETTSSGHLRIATYYQAGVRGTQVGGDWYDVIDLGANRSALIVGDVMGRGVRAAAVMGQLRASVRAFARMGLAPAEVMEFMDATVRELPDGQIVTCVYAVHDPIARRLVYANAGHLPPIVWVPGVGAARLPGLAPPLGAGPTTFVDHEHPFPVGATVAFYTDGLVERRDEPIDGRIDQLAACLSGVADIDHLVGEAVELLCPEGADDDVALLVARASADTPSARHFVYRVPPQGSGVAASRRVVANLAREWGLVEEKVDDLELLTSELVTNALMHGQPPIELRIRVLPGEVLLEVLDGSRAIPRRLGPTPRDEHGRGLQFVDLLSVRSGVRLTERGKSMWCTVEAPSVTARE